MKISYNWLREYVDIKATPEKLAELLTMHSFEVEGITYQGKGLGKVVVGEVIEKKKHPNADRLSVVKVKIGKDETLEIVCGAPNIDVEQKVPVALVGAKLPNGMVIEKRKVRGIESCGMICAEDELELGNSHEGIMILDKNLETGKPLKEALELDDVVFDIDILPNRAHDCLSHIGVAREIAAITDEKLKTSGKEPNIKIAPESGLIKVDVRDEKLCKRYSAAFVKEVKIKKSPVWLERRIKSCGIKPINNIVDITNYIMLDMGQPMHAFDADKIKGKIIVRSAKKGEKIIALDDNEYELCEDDLVIADESGPIAIAGIMGGARTAVSESTRNVIFEAANFHPTSIRKTSKRLKLSSESSYRFEREVDPEMTSCAIAKAIEMTESLAQGIRQDIVDIYPHPVRKREIEFRIDKIEKLLGAKVEKERAEDILRSLGFEVSEKNGTIKVKVPTYRIDVEQANDVIEEIGRIYGYENIPETAPAVEMKAVLQDKSLLLEKEIRKILEGLGWSEVYNYSFVSRKDIENIGLKAEDHLEVENPLSEEFQFMRKSLLPRLLKNAVLNLKHIDSLRLFETGRIFLKGTDKLPDERKILAGIGVDKYEKDTLFYELKGQVETLLKKLGFDNLLFEEIKNPESFWHKGISAQVLFEDNTLGKIGEIRPSVLNAFGLEARVTYFEFDLETVVKLRRDEKRYRKINKFPSVKLDLSVVFEEDVKWSDIEKLVFSAGDKLATNVEPFDIYRGKELGKNKKSIAFRITYQAKDRTLKDEEVKATQNEIIKALEKLGGKVRNKVRSS